MTKAILLRNSLAALLCAGAFSAQAQISDLRLWTTAGDVLVVGGGSRALLSTAWLDEAPQSASGALLFDELEPALGLPPGSLPAETIEGSGLQHVFTSAESVTLSFDWQLSTSGFNANQADRAFVLVDGSTLVELGTVAAVPLAGRFSHQFAAGANHALAILVMDVNTADGVSILSLGNLSVISTPVPEPGQWALLLAGLAGVGALGRRRDAQVTR